MIIGEDEVDEFGDIQAITARQVSDMRWRWMWGGEEVRGEEGMREAGSRGGGGRAGGDEGDLLVLGAVDASHSRLAGLAELTHSPSNVPPSRRSAR